MEVRAVPGFKDIFNSPPTDKFRKLINHVPSSFSIGYFSSLNLTLSISPNKDQREYIETIFNRIDKIGSDFTDQIILQAKEKIINFVNEPDYNYTFFTPYYITAYLEKEIKTQEQKKPINNESLYILIIFIDYLIFIDEFNLRQQNELEKLDTDSTGAEFFINNFWPLLIRQFSLKSEPFPIKGTIKALAELKKYNDFLNEKYIIKFLKSYNCRNINEYIGFLFDIMHTAFRAEEIEFRSLIKPANNQTEEIFNSMSIQLSDFDEQRNSNNFLAIRKKPLFKIDKKVYCILNWGFFSERFSEGLRRDFYSKSGIKEKYPKYPDFKSKEISENISEKFFFRRLINELFKKQKNVYIKFDDKEERGLPDAYIRYNNKIILLEFKDYSVNADEIALADPNSFKKYISNRFINKNEGIPQLIKHITQITNGGFRFDKLNERILRNIRIYPLIITWNDFFDLPGLNLFLQSSFQDELSKNFKLKYSPDLTLCSFDSLLNHLDDFNGSGFTKFTEQLFLYHKTIKSYKKVDIRRCSQETLGNSNQSFSQFLDKKFKGFTRNKQKYLDDLIRTFDVEELIKKS